MKIKCLLFGHKKYSPNVLKENSIISLHDALGEELVNINVCERCGAVFSDLFLTSHNSSQSPPHPPTNKVRHYPPTMSVV